MKRLLVILMALGLAVPASAVLFKNSSDTVLGNLSKVKCSTGVTCTVSNGYLTIVSSPSLTGPLTLQNSEVITNATDDVVEVQSEDNDTTLQVTGFEAKNAILNLYPDQGDDNADKFSIKADTSDLLTFNNNGTAFLTFDSSGNGYGAGTGTLHGFLQKETAATATTITADQCGSTFYNSGAVTINLPNGSAALIGCRITFITMNASNFDVNPGNSDQIILLTDAAGDAIRNATIGNFVTLQYVATNKWIDVGHIGTWSDIN